LIGELGERGGRGAAKAESTAESRERAKAALGHSGAAEATAGLLWGWGSLNKS
jgi:hypothetical protein